MVAVRGVLLRRSRVAESYRPYDLVTTVGPSKEWEWPDVTDDSSAESFLVRASFLIPSAEFFFVRTSFLIPSGESFLVRASFLIGESTFIRAAVPIVGVMSFLDARMDEDRELFCCS